MSHDYSDTQQDNQHYPMVEVHRHERDGFVDVTAWEKVEGGKVMARERVSLRPFQYVVHVTLPPPMSYMSGPIKNTDDERLQRAINEAATRAKDLVAEKLRALSRPAEEATP